MRIVNYKFVILVVTGLIKIGDNPKENGKHMRSIKKKEMKSTDKNFGGFIK